jgi:hypothetical protein
MNSQYKDLINILKEARVQWAERGLRSVVDSEILERLLAKLREIEKTEFKERYIIGSDYVRGEKRQYWVIDLECPKKRKTVSIHTNNKKSAERWTQQLNEGKPLNKKYVSTY